jgi:hypothetical protein
VQRNTGSDFLEKLSEKFGGIMVCGYTGDVETWRRNGRRVWASYGTATWEKKATAVPWFGDGINGDFLFASNALLGSHWNANVNIGHFHGSGGPLTLKVRTNPINGPNFNSPLGGLLTEVLIGGPALATIVGSHNGFSGGFPPQPIPFNPALLCANWACQATVVGGGFADLSTAVAGSVGTY